ncbi:MAG: hypothetical protein II916_08785 [Oscillospiraceae bacterium]|nr:hypothetical protein [Oscillospiraceae bacterium]
MYLASFTFTVAVLPVLLLCYYFIPAKGKTAFLLVCSFLIYAWGAPVRALYLLAYLGFDYGMGLLLEFARPHRTTSTFLLGGSAVLQVAVMTTVREFAAAGGLLFPFGIAIYTLQGLGYLIGIYRGRHPASRNFLHLALYLSFFPMLYAGPVVNYLEFNEQMQKRQCNIICLSEGLALFIQGLAEKVVLADTFGYMFRELRAAGSLSMLTAWLMTISFAMYLYFELLGYSEMARGLGKAFGFDLPKNFNHPFFTPSITSFMQSWNITLLLWFQTNFRHFLFGKVEKKWQKYAVIILTWVFIGGFYGMRVQFLLWGLAIGVLVTIEQLVIAPLLNQRYLLGMIYTALLMQFVWVLFFAENLTEVGYVWRTMLGFGSGIADQNGLYFFTSYIALILLGLYVATDLFRNISDRIGTTAFGRAVDRLKPIWHGLLMIFCLASMLYGERAAGLWLLL